MNEPLKYQNSKTKKKKMWKINKVLLINNKYTSGEALIDQHVSTICFYIPNTFHNFMLHTFFIYFFYYCVQDVTVKIILSRDTLYFCNFFYLMLISIPIYYIAVTSKYLL